MHFYRIAGLAVASEIELPGLIVRGEGDGPPDVSIRLGPVPLQLEGAVTVRPTFEIAGDRFLLRIPGVARLLLQAGREIVIAIEDGTPQDDVAIFIIGTVFGILLHQREQAVFHASAVRVGDRAVLFCGVSGAGKSTMAAALAQRGYAMLADDVCAITMSGDGRAMAQPDGRQLKLWSRTIDKLDLGAWRGAAVRSKLEKFYVEPPLTSSEALPVGAVYILSETRPPHGDGIERPNFVDAAIMIRRNAYRPRLVHDLGQSGSYLQSSAAIIASAGLFVLRRPFEFAAMPSVIGMLENHWRATGLLVAAS